MPGTIRYAFIVLLLAVASGACAEAQSACPPVAQRPSRETALAAMRNAHDHGFLWRISKDGRTSFLYGTIHVAKFEWMFPGPSVMQALRETDTMALELDMLDEDIQSRMLNGMREMHSATLPEPLVKRMQQQAQAVCVPYAAVAKLSPELQITTLTMMVGRREGLDASYAIDAVLAGMAHGGKMKVVSLETPEAQLQALQTHSPQETLEFVADGLDEIETGRARATFGHIARVWANSDYADLARYEDWCDCLKTASEREEMKRLLDERNPNLADRIDTLHAGGKRVFAAVGSLHMFGALGLPVLMERRGYRVERVDMKPM